VRAADANTGQLRQWICVSSSGQLRSPAVPIRFQQSLAAIGRLVSPESKPENPSLISPHSLPEDGPFGTAVETRGSGSISPPLCAQGQGEQGLVMPGIEINRFLKALLTPCPISY